MHKASNKTWDECVQEQLDDDQFWYEYGKRLQNYGKIHHSKWVNQRTFDWAIFNRKLRRCDDQDMSHPIISYWFQTIQK